MPDRRQKSVVRAAPGNPIDGGLYREARDGAAWRFVAARLVGFFVLVVYVLAVPSGHGWTPRLVAAGVALSLAPVAVWVERAIRADARDATHGAVLNTALLVAAAVTPDHWLAAFAVFVATSMTLIGNGAQRFGLSVIAVSALGFVVTAIVHDVAGGAPAIVLTCVVFALSQLYYSEWRRRRAEVDQRYEQLVSAAKLFFWEIDIESEVITAVHGDVEGALGWTADEALGQSFRNFLVEPEVVAFAAVVDGMTEFDRVLEMYHRDGHTLPIRNQIRVVGNGRLQAAASDISELADAAAQLRHQSEHDELTGLLNRQGLLARVAEQLESTADGLCLLAIDLIRFKEINDAFGHARGDEVLRVVGNRLAMESGSEIVARLGGNEFAVLLPCGGREDTMTAMVERIGAVVRHPVAIGGAGIAIRASLGVARVRPGVSPMELLREADVATHEAKLNNLSWACYREAPTEPIVERLTLAAQLDPAIEQGQFELWVQPKVSLDDHKLVGVEALARWNHPELGLLTPNRFIPLIEISDAYHRFSDAMVRQALDIAIACQPHWPDVEIAVNLHPRSFDEPKIVDRIGHMLQLTGVYPSRLKLEITEVDALAESGVGLDTCRSLAELGIAISVDDFGTGHASLNRLRLIAPTEVKLDQAFIRNLDHNAADQTIVRSTVKLAESLGMTCVAEGVETEAVREIVQALGCPVVQGYLFGRPMRVADFLAQLSGDAEPIWKQPFSAPALGQA